jgi:phage baseplate assembly protein W
VSRLEDQRYVSFPLRITEEGRTALAGFPAHVEQLIEELLFTDPGERVNRPTLGLGLVEFVFDTPTDELLIAKRFLIQAGLQEWLGHLLQVDAVGVRAVGSELDVTIDYRLVDDGQRRTVSFRR